MESMSGDDTDARVERLWRTLDTRKEGQLDLNGLKRGLKKMDHRQLPAAPMQRILLTPCDLPALKNADLMLRDVMTAVDKNSDGKIQYEEFRRFVEETEKELRTLFDNIDRDHNGKLDKSELQIAFSRAGLAVPTSKLDHFFAEVDTNHDGVISFDEWRNFLLFIPADTPSLKAVLSYYSSVVTLNSEGDVQVNGEAVNGLGTPPSFPTSFISAIVSLANPYKPASLLDRGTSNTRYDRSQPAVMVMSDVLPYISSDAAPSQHRLPPSRIPFEPPPVPPPLPSIRPPTVIREFLDEDTENWRPVLTELLPDAGYFLAGGIAGVASRTLTAPLDRLKVYLIAQTGDLRDEALVNAAKKADLSQAARRAGRPLLMAVKELWRAGGIRSLFAGNGLNVVKVMPESAIKFGSYEGSKRAFAKLEGHNDPRAINPWSKFMAGGMGGMISQFFVYPIDTLKFRMQCETVPHGLYGNRLIVATFLQMWRSNGIHPFYRGLPMGLVGMFPYAAIDLSTFEYLKRIIASRNAKRRGCHEEDAGPGSFMTAGIGALSGALGASVVYPLNVLRTRLQAQGTKLHPQTYTGMVDVARKTLSREGVKGLFRGITPNLLKVVPAVSITYVVYENSKLALGLR